MLLRLFKNASLVLSFPTTSEGDSSEPGGGNLHLKPAFTDVHPEIQEDGGGISLA